MKAASRMKVGTKSVLFGVHAFWWHPITVALAWRRYHGAWPKHLTEWVAIFCHDLGYWGMPNMDGVEGVEHPWRGARIAEKFFKKRENRVAVVMHVLGHSKSFSRKNGFSLSPLYAPDKLCAVYDPAWFYVLRASLSGEIVEFMQNAPVEVQAGGRFKWYRWYRDKVRKQFGSRAKV